MFQRHLDAQLRAALSDSPVVLLNGARQAGKSTLARRLPGRRHLSLDDAATLAAAHHDPAGFIAGLQDPVVLDEIQKAPGLLPAIKAEVDRDRRPGRFLLTGSADVLLLPRVSESLAGRMEILTLWPLSQGEIEGRREAFVDALFADAPIPPVRNPVTWPDLLDRMAKGGYPEPLQRDANDRREAWFRSYLSAILQRDVRELAHIESLSAMPRLLALLGARAASILNISEISRSLGVPLSTLKRHLTLLETAFLVQTLPAWSGNLGKRLVRAPKVMLNDTGVLIHLLGTDAGHLGHATGHVLENFVAMEIRKQAAWSAVRPGLFHFRTHAGAEVDLVLEDRAGRLVGVEVKAAATVDPKDLKGLRALQETAGKRFKRGVLLYGGTESVPFEKNLAALPVSALWRTASAS